MFNDNSGQVSAELILLMACILMVVISAISIYTDYLEEFAAEINETELDTLKNKIDKINEIIK